MTFIAISPELPDTSLSLVEKAHLGYPVLTDQSLKLARQVGIVVQQAESVHGVHRQFGTDIKQRTGSSSLELPVPATFLVDRKGMVRESFVDADYTKRLDRIRR